MSKSWFWLTFLAAMLLFAAVNVYDYLHAIPPCCDFGVSFGVPVALGRKGGFIGGTYFYADRLVVVTLIASAVAMLLGLVAERIALKKRGRQQERWTMSCPLCEQMSRDHQFRKLASIAVGDGDDHRYTMFVSSIKNHDWTSVLAFQEWEGGCNDYELYALRADDHPLVLVIVRDPLEVFENERVAGVEILDEAQSSGLLRMAGDRGWKPIASYLSRP